MPCRSAMISPWARGGRQNHRLKRPWVSLVMASVDHLAKCRRTAACWRRCAVVGGGLGTLPAMEGVGIGGHGQGGLRLLRLPARDGHRGRGVIRKAEQPSDLQAAGAEAVLCDLERGDDLRPHLGGADAIVFAAGAGPGSGPERKRTVDYGAAVTSMQAATDLEVPRFVTLSSIGPHDIAGAAGAMRPYLQAKRDADDALKQSGLDWTIVKP